MTRFRADLILVGCAAIWGFAFLFQKSAMAHVGPFAFIAARSVVACLALAPLAWREGDTGRRALSPLTLVAGVSFFLGAAFQQVGLVTATVTNTGFLTALYVVVTPFIVWGFTGRPPARLVWFAAALSFAGTWLLGGGTLSALSRGDVLVAISAGFWALHVVLLGRASRHGCPATFTALQFVVVGALGLVGALALETTSVGALRHAAIDIAFVGLLSSALTFTLFTIALRATQPAEAAIIVSSETLFAAIGAYLVLGERLSLAGWIGAGIILAATLMVQLAPMLARSRALPDEARSRATRNESP